jgi:hypothetical protein
VVAADFTMAEVNPALTRFVDSHKASLAEAHALTEASGRGLAGELTTAAA